MALIYCPDCGTQVSEHAQACIKCFYPVSNLRAKPSNQNNSTAAFNPKPLNSTNNVADNGLIISGYIVAFLSFLTFPLLFLIAGVVIGIICISKGSIGHGIAHIILSFVLGMTGLVIGALISIF
jgi:ribosomal protein L40E